MRILVVHNEYRQAGGEDVSVGQEVALLRAGGHDVVEYRRSNREIDRFGAWQRARLPVRAVWSRESFDDISRLIAREAPVVAHVHNTHLLVSPSVYHACWARGIPVVQTVHNYRLLCPAANFLRAGRVCEDCMGKAVAWPGVLHACYRGSRSQTAMVAATLAFHRWRGTWTERVARYVVLTEFVRRKLVEGGLPGERIVVKPNALHPDPGYRVSDAELEGAFLYVGRLSSEKGLDVLLAAWRHLARTGRPVPKLRIVGDGPLAPDVAAATADVPRVEWLGAQPRDTVLALMRQSLALVAPSTCYEGLPLVVVEAFAVGLPIIAPDQGSLATLVRPRDTGLHFRSGGAEDLATKVMWLLDHGSARDMMGRQARAEFEAVYTGPRNYEMLIAIYESVLGQITSRAAPVPRVR